MTRPIGPVFSLVLLALIFGGCSKREESVPLRLMLHAGDAEFARIRANIAAYEQHNPGVCLEVVRVGPSEDYLSDLLVALVSEKKPDVFEIDARQFAVLREKDLLLDLSGRVDDLFDFQPRVTECFYWKNRLWAVPMSCQVAALYYNRQKFDRAGVPFPTDAWDWSDLKMACARLTLTEQGGTKVIQYAMDLDPGLPGWAPFVLQNGGEMVDPETGRWVIGAPGLVDRNAAALDYYTALIHESRAAPVVSPLAPASDRPRLFQNRQAAMVIADRRLETELPAEGGMNWDVCVLPKGARRATTLTAEGFAISRGTAHPDAAWKLLRHLTGPTSQTRSAMTGLSIPSRVSVGRSKVFLDYPGSAKKNNAAFIDSLYYARFLQAGSRWPEIEKILAEETDFLFSTGKGSARDSLLKAQARIDALLGYASEQRLAPPPERARVKSPAKPPAPVKPKKASTAGKAQRESGSGSTPK